MPEGVNTATNPAIRLASPTGDGWRRAVVRQVRGSGLTGLLLLPSLLLVGLFLGVPLTVVLISSFEPNVLISADGPGLFNYQYLLSKPYYFDILIRTIRLAVLGTVFTLPFGYIAAMLLLRLSGRAVNLAMMGLTFPILAGPLVVILGWMALLPNRGPIFGPLVRWGWMSPPNLLGTEAAVLVSLVQFMLPFAILTLYTSLKQIPRDLYEAANSLGAGPVQGFLHVTLPLSLPGVLSSAIIVFSLGASSYISPHYLGGAAELTLTTLIAQFILATYNSPLAAASAILLLGVMVACMLGLVALFGRLIRP
jgi:ABC-type spermidine/putrescine transport system permease subunit I